MRTTTLTIRVSEDYQDVLTPLDGQLVADEHVIELMLRGVIEGAACGIAGLVEDADNDALRARGRRLELGLSALEQLQRGDTTCRLRGLRQCAPRTSSMSLRELSEHTGFDTETLRSWETEREPIPAGHAKTLAGFFHVSVEHLLGADRSPLSGAAA